MAAPVSVPNRLEPIAAREDCPVCASPSLREYCEVPSRFREGETIRYSRCARCELVFRNPAPPPVARLQAYEDVEIRPGRTRLQAKKQRHYRFMLRELKRHAHGESLHLLDFGSGAGGLLVAGREAGFEVTGLEVQRAMAAWVAENRGVRVLAETIDGPGLAGETFDCITSTQVFEHLVDPRATLQSLLPKLRPGGLLLTEVPNLLDFREVRRRGSTMDDSHLFYFSAASLSQMLRAEGLEIVCVREGLRPWGWLGAAAEFVPLALLHTAERLSARVGLRTGLSVVARRPA